MIFPQIVYNNPTTGVVTVPFKLPHVQKPGANDLASQRADSFTMSGKKRTLWWRTDEFLILNMDYLDILADVPTWDAFVHFAISGGQFAFYPDATDLSTSLNCTLEDTDWTPKFSARTITKFTLKCRVAPFSANVVGASFRGNASSFTTWPTTLVVPFVQVGDILLVMATYSSTLGGFGGAGVVGPTGISDTSGNAYTQVYYHSFGGTSRHTRAWYAIATASASPLTLTETDDNYGINLNLLCVVCRGQMASSFAYGTANGTGGTASISIGSNTYTIPMLGNPWDMVIFQTPAVGAPVVAVAIMGGCYSSLPGTFLNGAPPSSAAVRLV